jgi:hypothetical protein
MQLSKVLARIQASNPPTFPPNTRLYHTTNAGFSAYLITANVLRYKETTLPAHGFIASFTFYDPAQQGEAVASRYAVGAVELVNPKVLHDVRSALIREAIRLQKAAGVQNAEQSY